MVKPGVHLTSSPVKRAELNLIEKQIEELSGMPDFGYGASNQLIDFESAKNWQLLAGFAQSNGKFSYLENHIKLVMLNKSLQKMSQDQVAPDGRSILKNKEQPLHELNKMRRKRSLAQLI